MNLFRTFFDARRRPVGGFESLRKPLHLGRCGLAVLVATIALPLAFVSMTVAQDAPVESGSGQVGDTVDLVILGGHVFDTASGAFRRNPGLAVEDGRFVEFKPKTKGARRVQLQDDHYILPGLVDCHAHYNVRLFDRRREEFDVMPVQYLANGVTVTFSCGEFLPEEMRQLRIDIDAGKKVGPRLVNSGPYFGRARPGWRGIRSPDEIVQDVDFWVDQGVGGFKAKAIAPEELRVLIERAHHHGLTVTGHLDSGYRNSVNPRDAILMGIDRIEHFLGGDAMPESRSAYASLPNITADMPEFQSIVKLYLERGVWFDATLTAYGYFGHPGEEFEPWMDERQFFTPYVQTRVAERGPTRPMELFDRIYRAKLKTIDDFWKAGGKITLGTDHFSNGHYLPGFGAHRELDAFVRAGIPAVDAIRIATINGATALGLERDHGSIDAGKYADLFVITGNPLDNIRNTRNVEHVMTRGRWYDSAALFESIRGRLGPAGESEATEW